MTTEISLETNYGGLHLASPVVMGACPMTMQEPTRNALQSAGAGAVVFPSLFEEQLIQWCKDTDRPVSKAEQIVMDRSERIRTHWACPNAESYLALINRATTTRSLPVIASLNGYTAGGWVDFAGELQEVGAAAIELNVHHSQPRNYESSSEIEDRIIGAVRDIRASITIPLFVKLGRGFTSIPHIATRLLSGAQGLVLHGRDPQVDICLDSMKLATKWKLSVADCGIDSLDTLMQVHGFCPAMPLAASGGIAHADDVTKVLLAGADVAMVTSAVYRDGPDIVRTMLDGLRSFMKKNNMNCIGDLQTHRPLQFTSDEERSAYTTALSARLGTSQAQTGNQSIRAGN
ncbi:MAG: dihydroorotate dehydrogenase-like protein [Rubripirellula sp.]